MASKAKRILKQPRIWLLLFFLAISILTIPSFKPDGIEASHIATDSPFYGLINEGDLITSVNGIQTLDFDDYSRALYNITPDDAVTIIANGKSFKDFAKTDPDDNETTYIGINIRKTNSLKLELGLDLQGGARVMLNPIPAQNVTMDKELVDTTTSVLMARLNAYGLRNVVVRTISDVDKNMYIQVEMAGEGSEKVVDIVKSVGKFELKIFNETVFTGDAIVPPIGEPRREADTGQWQVPFTINTRAATTMRKAYVDVVPENPSSCSTEDDCAEDMACSYGLGRAGICLPRIEMFLDEQKEFSAPPAQSLHQNWIFGEDSKNLLVESKNYEDAKKVEIVLKAGRLPTQIKELEVTSQDYVDPTLGKDFLRGAVIAAGAALLAVGLILFIRYRRFKIAIPIMFMGFAEVAIILGMASLIRWSIDLPAIAGIIAAVGTGVDQQIIITDELLGGGTGESWSLKKGVKKAYGIIIAAVSTTIAVMLPLAYPGFTGLYVLRGFAIVTILGVLIGILITRPAYAKIAEVLLEE